MNTALSVLKETFGYQKFRRGQQQAISAFLAGRDVQVLLPTGGGKSLCYQIPAIMWAQQGLGFTLVVSPLIALMRDQITQLNRLGVNAYALHSGMTYAEQRAVKQAVSEGQCALLYASPERLKGVRFRKWLATRPLAGVAIDEAHCISEWGHDFRPDYLKLGELRSVFDGPMMAVTATATHAVVDEIAHQLSMREPARVTGSFARENLQFSVRHIQGDKARVQALQELLQAPSDTVGVSGRTVIYAATRKRAKAVQEQLRRAGFPAVYYHAGRSDRARERAHDAFEDGRKPIMVATTAFGMGVDHPDVRLVAHVQAPGSLEAYYQQAGRAGRDGRLARCVLLYSTADAMVHARIRGDNPHEGRIEGYSALQNYIWGTRCRQQVLCAYFGETELAPCGTCDVCTEPSAVANEVDAARSAYRERDHARREKRKADDAVLLSAEQLDAIVGFVEGLRKPVGKVLVAKGLRGSHAKAVKRAKLSDNPLFGVLKEQPERAVIRAVQELLDAGRLARRGKKYPTVWIPDKRVRPKQTRPAAVGPPPSSLKRALKEFRKREARKRRWKAYQVFSNATLDLICEVKPRSLNELLTIKGMGPTRIGRFGERILTIVDSYA